MWHWSLLLALVASSCGIYISKNSPTRAEGLALMYAPGSIDYNKVRTTIFEPKCLTCHSGQNPPTLTSYQQVKANIELIRSVAVIRKTMPKREPLNLELRSLLEQWIVEGATETAQNPQPTPNMTPTPSPTPSFGSIERPVRFAELKARVLEPNCNSCHFKGNTQNITPLDNFDDVIGVKDWLKPIIFGVAGENNEILVPVEQRMPPPKSPPLNDEQKAFLLLWFADGMKN